jgi:hypothetical protein
VRWRFLTNSQLKGSDVKCRLGGISALSSGSGAPNFFKTRGGSSLDPLRQRAESHQASDACIMIGIAKFGVLHQWAPSISQLVAPDDRIGGAIS